MLPPVETAGAPDVLFRRAQGVPASGVSASMRLRPYVLRPLVLSRGEDPSIFALDGRRYLDFNMSDGWALLGRDHELTRQFVVGCVERGVSFHGYTRQGPPGHAGFSLAHSDEDFAETLTVVEDAVRVMGDRVTGC